MPVKGDTLPYRLSSLKCEQRGGQCDQGHTSLQRGLVGLEEFSVEALTLQRRRGRGFPPSILADRAGFGSGGIYEQIELVADLAEPLRCIRAARPSVV
jgi:hypothetical protein